MDAIADVIIRMRGLCDEALKACPKYETQAKTPYAALRKTIEDLVGALDEFQDEYCSEETYVALDQDLARDGASLSIVLGDSLRSTPPDTAESPLGLAAGNGNGLGRECGAVVPCPTCRVPRDLRCDADSKGLHLAPGSMAGEQGDVAGTIPVRG